MSAVGGWLARAFASLGGPQMAVAVLVAGIVAGGLGGWAIATGQRASAPAANGVAVFPCPNQGPALLTVASGQQLLVTGRLADSSWLRIHLPEPGRTEGWIKASVATVNGPTDSLPVVTCQPVAAVPPPAIAPLESMTAVVNATPSPGPTSSPTPSPPPTPSPTANAGPTLASLAASTSTISYDQGSYCPTAAKSVTISLKASDSSGVGGVVLFWREPGAASYAQTAMSMSSGSASSGTWQATLNTASNGITQAGTLAYYAVATDSAGATSRTPSSGTRSITVKVCGNVGPTITSASSSSGSSLYSDPTGHGGCQTATDITAVITDVDGIKSVRLYYRKPGTSTYASKAMNNTTVAGKWYANLDTLGDHLAPPNGTLSWYIRAVDAKGVASQTKTSSITIRPCGIVITSFTVSPTNVGFKAFGAVCSNNKVTVTLKATDAGATLLDFATLYGVDPTGAQHTWELKGSGTYQYSLYAGAGLQLSVQGTWKFWAVLADATGQSVKSPSRSIDVSPGYCK